MTRIVSITFIAISLALIGPAQAQDASELIVRLNRVEGQMRQLSGQVEQLQFDNKQLKDQLRKFQEDVEFRFQERSGSRGAPAPTTPRRPEKRSDAFDPDADPNAPGAPRPLGQPNALPPVADGRPVPRGPGAMPGPIPMPAEPAAPRLGSQDDEDEDGPASARPLDLGAAGRVGGAAPAPSTAAGLPPPGVAGPGRAPSVAAATGDPRGDYDVAYAYLIQRQYEQAEMAFRRFIQSHPRDRLAPDAVYWLGETYMQRNRPREAAEQYLKVSTEYARATKAPDAMLKLGVALTALGAREQACATFAELERKYPAAAASVKQGTDREQKRARCTT